MLIFALGNWQDLAAIFLVLTAASYLAAKALETIRHRASSGCGGGCRQCVQPAVAKPPADPTIISRDQLTESARRLPRRDL